MAAPAQGAVEAAKAELGSELSQLQAAISPQGQISASPPKPETGSPPSPASPSPPGEPGAPAAPTSATPPSTPATAPAAPAPGQPGSEPPSSLASAAPAAPNVAVPTGPASPQEQVWMARALDTLDAALNSQPPSPSQTAAGSAPPPPSASSATPPPSPAQASLASAAQAAAAAMRAARSESAAPPAPQPSSTPGTSERSLAGAETEMPGAGYQIPGKLPAAGKNTDWGKLPKKVAEELSQGQREAVAGEYRNQVETYYRVIAERSKKP